MSLMAAPDLTRRPRTRIAFSDADMVRLRDLYYDTAIPMVKVAQAFGVSASTLFHWIAEMDWPRRSTQAPRIDARVDLFSRVQAQPREERSRRRKGPPPDKYDLARDVAFAARAELDALAAERGRPTLEDRRRRAAVIDQLSRAVARMERVQAKRFAVYDDLEKSVEALARDARRSKREAARKRPEPVYRKYGAGGMPEGGW